MKFVDNLRIPPTESMASIDETYSNTILIGLKKWIDIETQESNDPCCFQVSKFIIRLRGHSQKDNREEDAGVRYDQVIDECNKKVSEDTGYWSDEMMKQFANAPYWAIDKWISVGGQKKRFQYYLNPNYPRKLLYLRAIQGHSGSTINPALQDNVL